VTIVILLVLVVVLWVVVLAPGAWRRRAERQGVGSIDHFHHQLQLLEHAGPKLVAPAYRLHTAMPGGGTVETHSLVDVDDARPKLVLLRPVDDEQSSDIDGNDGCHYERVGVLGTPPPATSMAETRAGLAAYRRQQARQRCTMLLRCLTGVSLSTGLLGMFSSMRLAWVFTGLTGIAALALVGLIAYAREIEAHQRRPRVAAAVDSFEDDMYYGAAEAGYPGAWDDEDEFPRQASAAR
jgi:hypothetical protein